MPVATKGNMNYTTASTVRDASNTELPLPTRTLASTGFGHRRPEHRHMQYMHQRRCCLAPLALTTRRPSGKGGNDSPHFRDGSPVQSLEWTSLHKHGENSSFKTISVSTVSTVAFFLPSFHEFPSNTSTMKATLTRSARLGRKGHIFGQVLNDTPSIPERELAKQMSRRIKKAEKDERMDITMALTPVKTCVDLHCLVRT